MKGIIFTEFLDLVEDRFGDVILDQIIEASTLEHSGAYTTVGTYDRRELLQLVGQLSALTGTPVPKLVYEFGTHLFGRFAAGYPALFEGINSAFEFLTQVDSFIHVEVRKLYPDAELPRFEYTVDGRDRMNLVYRSARPFADLAEGLIAGCARHFGEPITIERRELPADHGYAVEFRLTKSAPESDGTGTRRAIAAAH